MPFVKQCVIFVNLFIYHTVIISLFKITGYNNVFFRYGGPDTQRVTQAFRLGWEEYLVSSHNVIIGFADGRGGGGRGQNWLHSNYRHLGTTEVEDTVTAGQYEASIYPLEIYDDHSVRKADWASSLHVFWHLSCLSAPKVTYTRTMISLF